MLTEALARIPEDGSELRMRVELALGEIAMRRGEPEIARSSVERWLRWAREEGGPSDVAWALSSLSSIYMREGDFAGSVALLDEALEAARTIGDTRLLSNVAGNLGYALSAVGEYERAARLCRESIELAPTASDVCVDHANLGLALLGLGDLEGAASEYRLAIVGAFESGYFFTLADAMVGAAAIAFRRGAAGAALGILAAVDKLRDDLGLSADPVGARSGSSYAGCRTRRACGRGDRARLECGWFARPRRGDGVRPRVHRLTRALPTPPRDLREWIALLEREGELQPHLRRGRPRPRDHRDHRPRRQVGRAGAPLREPEGLAAPAPHQPVRHRAAHVPGARGRDARRRGRQARRHPRHAAARGHSREGARAPQAEVGRGLAAEGGFESALSGDRAGGGRGRPRSASDPALLAGRPGAVHHAARGHHEGSARRVSATSACTGCR